MSELVFILGFRAASAGNRPGSSEANLWGVPQTVPGGQAQQTTEEESTAAVQEGGEEGEGSAGSRVPAEDQEWMQLSMHQRLQQQKQRWGRCCPPEDKLRIALLNTLGGFDGLWSLKRVLSVCRSVHVWWQLPVWCGGPGWWWVESTFINIRLSSLWLWPACLD